MENRDAFVSSLFQPKAEPKGPLVEDLDVGASSGDPPQRSVAEPVEEEKSMLELMMEAQKEAKKEKDKAKAKEDAKVSKEIGSGFKKGFFSSKSVKKTPSGSDGLSAGGKTASRATHSAASGTTAKKDENLITLTKPKPNANIANKGSNDSLVMKDVQEAMKADENPMLQDLRKGDWANDDLTNRLQSNAVIRKGMRNPKCMAAMQLFQSNPKEAQARFQGDAEVEAFMREFSGVMSEHFTSLGEKQEKEAAQVKASAPTHPLVQPVSSSNPPISGAGGPNLGPLHKQALANSHKTTTLTQTESDKVEEQKKVDKILANEELREMLLDPKLQQILQECGDPAKFQRHMSDPETARKIKLLFENGLVGTAK